MGGKYYLEGNKVGNASISDNSSPREANGCEPVLLSIVISEKYSVFTFKLVQVLPVV